MNEETETTETPTPEQEAPATPPPSAPSTSPPPPRQSATVPAARDPQVEQRAIRRGCFSIIFGAVLGAIVGAALTLALLAWLNNGLLTYNDADVALRRQLDGEIATREALSAEQATAVQAMNEASNRMNETMGTADADMAALRVTAVYLETRISGAGNAADTINDFLGGLDSLLNELTPAATALPETAVPEMTPTP